MELETKLQKKKDSFLMMETAYYHEEYHLPLNTLKRKMTLELNSDSKGSLKKTKYTSLQTPIFQNEVLASPDLQMCKLASPDLETIIQGMPVNTPNIFFPKSVSEEQEAYSAGFDDALLSLKKQNQLQHQTQYVQQAFPPPMYAPSESNSDDSSLLSESSSAYGHSGSIGDYPTIKQESYQSSPPPISPMDEASQEKVKLERKRQRNRLAASKCRKRKLEKISNLERKVNQLKKDNSDLTTVLEKLQKNVGDLKDQVMKHVQSGCSIMMTQSSF